MEPQMISDFNSAPCDGPLWVWIWLGVCFLIAVALILLDAFLSPRRVLGLSLLKNERTRREMAEEMIIELEVEINSYKRKEHIVETANRKGFTVPEKNEKKQYIALQPRTPEERAQTWGLDGDNNIEF